MRPSTRAGRSRRLLLRALAVVLAAVPLVAGCGSSANAESSTALNQVTAPDWFTRPADHVTEDGFTRTYARLPRSAADAELGYSQALGRAGWRFHDSGSACGRAQSQDGCWTAPNFRLVFRATGNDGPDAATGPSTLTVVVSPRT